MATQRLLCAALAATLSLTACAMPSFVAVHDQSVEEAAQARLECTAISEGMTPPVGGGFVAASGRPAFVGGVMGGYAIGLAIAAGIRQQHKVDTYTDCMIAHGFRRADSVAVAAPPAPTPPVAQAAPILLAPQGTPISLAPPQAAQL